jgi:hypothetical protein
VALLGGLVGKVIGVVILLVVVVIAAGAFAYATDYGVEATVQEKECSLNPSTVTVKTKMGGLVETVDVARQECGIIEVGNFVIYHIRSGRTTIYNAEGGQCVYDTQTMNVVTRTC